MTLQVTVGIAPADVRADTHTTRPGDRLHHQADQARSEAKRRGRNRVEVYGEARGASAVLPLA